MEETKLQSDLVIFYTVFVGIIWNFLRLILKLKEIQAGRLFCETKTF